MGNQKLLPNLKLKTLHYYITTDNDFIFCYPSEHYIINYISCPDYLLTKYKLFIIGEEDLGSSVIRRNQYHHSSFSRPIIRTGKIDIYKKDNYKDHRFIRIVGYSQFLDGHVSVTKDKSYYHNTMTEEAGINEIRIVEKILGIIGGCVE